MDNRICKRCLMSDMDSDEFFQNLQQYIKNINEDVKVDDEEYERRLSICRTCENLLYGMCRICGCFVEMRAAVGHNRCPDIKKKW